MVNWVKRTCLGCGLKSTPAAIGAHQSASGHEGYEEDQPEYLSYVSAHQRVARLRGSARNHTCVGCSGPGFEWSLNHSYETELLHNEEGMPYSLDIAAYEARCRGCHIKYDGKVDVARDSLARGRETQKRLQETDPAWVAKRSAKARELTAAKWSCGECDMVTGHGPLGRHQSASEHTGRTRIEGEQ